VIQYYDLFSKKNWSTILRIATIFCNGLMKIQTKDFLPDDFDDIGIAAEPQTIYKSNIPETNSKST
jgi:hypothetical protein